MRVKWAYVVSTLSCRYSLGREYVFCTWSWPPVRTSLLWFHVLLYIRIFVGHTPLHAWRWTLVAIISNNSSNDNGINSDHSRSFGQNNDKADKKQLTDVVRCPFSPHASRVKLSHELAASERAVGSLCESTQVLSCTKVSNGIYHESPRLNDRIPWRGSKRGQEEYSWECRNFESSTAKRYSARGQSRRHVSLSPPCYARVNYRAW